MPRIGPAVYETPDFQRPNYIVPFKPDKSNEAKRLDDFHPDWWNDRIQRGAFGRTQGDFDFVGRRPFFKDDADEDAEWGPLRLLGAGSYGKVGLWQKKNRANQLLDEVAIKEGVLVTSGGTAWILNEINISKYPRLLREVVVQADINAKDVRAAPWLRRYKFISDSANNRKGRYRSYLEFCPHGNLSHLSDLYRAWDQHLPEVFLWHVFHRLAISTETFRAHPPTDSILWDADIEKEDRRSGWTLHLDIKPSNTLLDWAPDPATSSRPEHDFPGPKVSDYGLSMYTCLDDEDNPDEMWWRRTRMYAPSEQIHYGAHWPIPPTGAWVRKQVERPDGTVKQRDYVEAAKEQRRNNNKMGARRGDIRFMHSTNIYGVGATMYHLVTLRQDKHLEQVRAKTFFKYKENGYHQISKVQTKKPGVYSSRLRNLVHRCLDPNPDNRPTQLELFDATTRGMRLAERRLRKERLRARRAAAPEPDQPDNEEEDNSLPTEKVYYKDHEINEMPQGDASFRPSAKEVIRLVHNQYVNPDIPKLKLPRAKYGKFPRSTVESSSSWRTLYDHTNDNPRWFHDPLV